MGSGSCSPSRGTGGCCRGPTARGERNARRRRPKVRGNGRYDDGRLDGDEVYANAAQRRAQASMTIPLSKTRSRASRKLVPSAVRSMGIAHSGSFRRSSYPPTGALSARNRRSAGWDCEELHVGDRDAQVPGDSTAPCRARGRERRRCCWHYALPSGTVALPFCLRILTPSVTGTAREKQRYGATWVPDPVRSNIGLLNSMVAIHVPIQPLHAEHVMENNFCPKIHPR